MYNVYVLKICIIICVDKNNNFNLILYKTFMIVLLIYLVKYGYADYLKYENSYHNYYVDINQSYVLYVFKSFCKLSIGIKELSVFRTFSVITQTDNFYFHIFFYLCICNFCFRLFSLEINLNFSLTL